MPQFVIEREIPKAGQLTDEELRAVSLKSLDSLNTLGPRIQWLHSYVTENKVYCVSSPRTRRRSRSTRG